MIIQQEEAAIFPLGGKSISQSLWHFPSEDHIATWQQYIEESQTVGVWKTLQIHLPQLQFPIQTGVSQSPLYQAATRRGYVLNTVSNIALQNPVALRLYIYDSIAGAIPVLQTGCHADFAIFVQAILNRNEPVEVPESTGAYMVAGYNNWDRIRAYRKAWEAQTEDASESEWQAEFKRLIPHKERYQDRFIILSDGPYSGVTAAEMALTAKEWRALSLKIRLEHECAHLYTKRAFGIMRRHAFDELLADYAGITAVSPHFRADWFLRFMGLEAYPTYRDGGRLQNYIDTPIGSEGFTAVQDTLKVAAENVERFDKQEGVSRRTPVGRIACLLTMMRFNLAQLASPDAVSQMSKALFEIEQSRKDGDT